MILLAVLFALMLQRALGERTWVAEPALLQRYVGLVRRALPFPRLWHSPALPYLLTLPWIALAIAIQWEIEHALLDLVFSAALLFLALGPHGLAQDIERLLEARATGDAETATRLARALMQGGEAETARQELVGALFIQSHERLFGVLLWFFAFGAVGAAGAGALAYRLVSRLPRLLHEQVPETRAEQSAVSLHAAFAWPTARVTAALYGLAGSMDDALAEWRRLQTRTFPGWRERTWAILAEVPAGSISSEEAASGPAAPASLEECLQEVRALQRRALLILLAIFAVFTIGELA